MEEEAGRDPHQGAGRDRGPAEVLGFSGCCSEQLKRGGASELGCVACVPWPGEGALPPYLKAGSAELKGHHQNVNRPPRSITMLSSLSQNLIYSC